MNLGITQQFSHTEAAVELAEHEVQRIEKALEFARGELQRAEALASRNVISTQSMDKAQVDVETTAHALEELELTPELPQCGALCYFAEDQ